MVFLTQHIGDYPGICQGKTRIPGVNDGEEFELTDVSCVAGDSKSVHNKPKPPFEVQINFCKIFKKSFLYFLSIF